MLKQVIVKKREPPVDKRKYIFNYGTIPIEILVEKYVKLVIKNNQEKFEAIWGSE